MNVINAKFFLIAAGLLILSGAFLGCGTNPGNAATATPVPLPSATTIRLVTPLPTRTITLTPTPAPAGTATPVIAEVTLRWDGALIADVDDVLDIVLHLKQHPGIEGGTGDEIQITVRYNPRLVTPEEIRRILEDLGFRTHKP